MDKISNNTDYVFVYEDGIKRELNKKVTIENGENLQEVLSDITRQSKLEFRAINNNIVVRERTGDQSLAGEASFQAMRVTGTVTSAEDNTGLPGVNIIQKGTATGTVSDIDGNYSLEVPSADAVLVFSSVGFMSEEIAVGGRSVINLTMNPDIQSLNEIVVTALGIEREQRSLGYDVGKVQGKDLTAVPQDKRTETLLRVKVSGVTVNQTGIAGSTVSVVIRVLPRSLQTISPYSLLMVCRWPTN
ncbi:MAG: carboxypeptidase-like regulatory domain-containing protein [Cyclobacteriaceae bacterium]|nr:carboxypeptidase-like regulatory domain-containing protein [Cyclobacteriaceae bacterium]